jgi:hypothetical protein
MTPRACAAANRRVGSDPQDQWRRRPGHERDEGGCARPTSCIVGPQNRRRHGGRRTERRLTYVFLDVGRRRCRWRTRRSRRKGNRGGVLRALVAVCLLRRCMPAHRRADRTRHRRSGERQSDEIRGDASHEPALCPTATAVPNRIPAFRGPVTVRIADLRESVRDIRRQLRVFTRLPQPFKPHAGSRPRAPEAVGRLRTSVKPGAYRNTAIPPMI